MSNKPKYKICKQVGQNIWGNSNKIKQSKLIASRRKRTSLYSQIFKHKKIISNYYGNLSKRHLNKIFTLSTKNASHKNNPLRLLEQRLDMIILRLHWTQSIFESRQFILHGHVLVNGKLVTYPSYIIQPGDIIQIKQTSIKAVLKKLTTALKTSLKNIGVDVPNYLEVNYNVMSAILLYIPNMEEIPYPIRINPYTIKYLYKV